MARIEFKGKLNEVHNPDGSFAWLYVKVPAITRSHCDMHAFRTHARIGGLANSDLFPAVLKRHLAAMNVKDVIRLDAIPEGVDVDCSGFLAKVTINIA